MDNPFELILKELETIKYILNNPRKQDPAEIIDRRELMKRLQITEQQIIRLVKRNLIPEIKLNTGCRYNWPEVVKAVEKLSYSKQRANATKFNLCHLKREIQ